MASTFFGLTIAGSGLSASQLAINTTANNIANVNTKGYTRQEAMQQAADSLRAHAKYGTMGSGVTTTGINQIRDKYYDIKYWQNNTKLGEYSTKYYYMTQIENYFMDDDSVTGFSSILDNMFNALDTLNSEKASDTSARNQFISAAQSLANYFNQTSIGLSKIQNDCNEEIRNKTDQINTLSQEISILNKQINIVEQQGGKANELRDQRALLVDELSAIVPVEVTETKVTNSNYAGMYTGGTEYVIKIDGQTLVDTQDYNTLKCIPRENKVNQSDNEGLYDIVWEATGESFGVNSNTMSGELQSLFLVRDGNNAENFKGKILTASGKTITLNQANITDVNKLALAEPGVITINNKEYAYDTFKMNTDGTYTFELKENLDAAQAGAMVGRSAHVGSSLDYMGVPYYQGQMNEFIREFAKQFNDIHTSGVDLNGEKANVFFVGKNKATGGEFDFDQVGGAASGTSDTYYQLTAANFSVSSALLKNPELMATSTPEGYTQGVSSHDLVGKMLKIKNDNTVFRGGSSSGFLKCILSDVAVDTQRAKTFNKTYQNMSDTIVNQRLSVSGVDEDEEALNLVKFQNGYNLASKMIQVMTETYDRLILETGV